MSCIFVMLEVKLHEVTLTAVIHSIIDQKDSISNKKPLKSVLASINYVFHNFTIEIQNYNFTKN